MVDVIWAALDVAGGVLGVLVLLAMALFPVAELVEARRDRSGDAGRAVLSGTGR